MQPPVSMPPGPLGIDARAMVTAAIVIAVLAAAAWGLRKLVGTRRVRGAVAVESVLSLGERRSLAIVAVEGRRLLLGLTPGSVALVTELQRPFSEALDASVQTHEAQ